MVTCANCGTVNPDGFKFCGVCGTSLTATAASPPEERKVVTALFCDLVGFTSTSESADPEDIDRMLGAYAKLAQSHIETYGGVIEKFIGDAVVGIFGVPAAHEDDPERAVRAGLRIAEDAEGLKAVGGTPLRLRIGINTGEALVRLGVEPATGERFLAGDAINTASRLQSVAPEMGVAVGLATYKATAAVFEYEELPPATLKGKTAPVRVFLATAPRARLGTNLTRAAGTPYIGREIDLALLKGLFDKTVASSSVQLVTVVGEPGIGKSRIVAELRVYVDARPELVTWRQGRCLPYG
jgi:class 3 adenylate cyclase